MRSTFVKSIKPFDHLKKTLFVLLFCIGIISQPIAIGGNGDKGPSEKNQKTVASFEIQSIKVSKDGLVSWTASNENGSLPYLVEQYVYDKWTKVSEVNGIGTPTPNSYSVPVILHSGENKFRVRQKGYDNISRFSDAISFYSKKEPVTYTVTDKNRRVEFSNDTYFIIYDPYGAIIKQGYGSAIDVTNYAKGYYCLIYDNKLGGFQKKKVLLKNTSFPIVINPLHLIQKQKLN